MQHCFYLTREKTLVEATVVEETAFKRKVEICIDRDGAAQVKTINVHPEGVAWGSMYPRLFKAQAKPEHVFTYKGRAVVQMHPEVNSASIPHEESYRFQPFIADVIDSIHSAENVLLTGGTGVGKTTHILQLAARVRQPVLRINFNGETRMSDLIGKVRVINGETVWSDGILPMAMRHGYWLLLDEIDFADPAVLSLLHPVLESNPMLVLKENGGEIIRAHSLFRVFATANSIGAMQDRASAYGGTNQMNEAFLDRWQVIFVDNLPEKEEIKVVRDNVPGINARTAKKIVGFANKVRSGSLDDGSVYSGDNFSTRKVLAWAKKTALHRDAIKGARLAWLDKMPKDEQDGMLRILSTHFGGKTKRKSTKLKTPKSRATTVIATPKRRGRPRKAVVV